ncbi:MAG: indolepyruvate oxidoreductase subunit beta [Victivallaceae bacterium]|nr:indolepyruvate oxidoreductase subunit beta [Victivallaceae bacterium]
MARNILLCGVGGQGILLAAKIIAAAAESAGFQVTTNEVHGMAQRGGSVTAQVRFGANVHSPLILEGCADVLASMEAAEGVRYAHWLKPGGFAVVSSEEVIPVTVSSGKAVYPADIEQRLRHVYAERSSLLLRDFRSDASKLGNPKLANTILLGALSKAIEEISLPLWHSAVASCVKAQFIEINQQAFDLGRSF